jgi:hypothetical protein
VAEGGGRLAQALGRSTNICAKERIVDFSKVASITIAYEDLQALLHHQTNNPTAETEVPELLRAAIASGVKVLLTDVHDQRSCTLRIDETGKFIYSPVV